MSRLQMVQRFFDRLLNILIKFFAILYENLMQKEILSPLSFFIWKILCAQVLLTTTSYCKIFCCSSIINKNALSSQDLH